MADRLRPLASRWDRIVAVAFVAVLVLPGVALVAGIRPPELENRAAVPIPRLDAAALADPATYKAIEDRVARDLPGRDIALGAYATLDYEVLRGSTDPQVVVGRGDWLFFRGELQPRCPVGAAELLRQLDDVASRASQAGIRVRFAIAPDKHTVYPDRVSPDPPLPTPCTDAMRDDVRAGMAARPDVSVDLWSVVLAERDAAAPDSPPLYFTQDSHWTPTTAMPAIGAIVESLAPDVWDPAEITVDGTTRFSLELARLMGLPRYANVPRYIVRPTVTVEHSVVATPFELTNASDIGVYTTDPSAKVVPGTTLVVYDSFFNINRSRIVPWFERTIWIHAGDLRDHPEVAALLPKIDTIVLARVERGAYEMDIAELLRPILDQGR
jgi:hypothetical protein